MLLNMIGLISALNKRISLDDDYEDLFDFEEYLNDEIETKLNEKN